MPETKVGRVPFTTIFVPVRIFTGIRSTHELVRESPGKTTTESRRHRNVTRLVRAKMLALVVRLGARDSITGINLYWSRDV